MHQLRGFILLIDAHLDGGVQNDGRLIGPAARHVPEGVAATAQDQSGHTKAHHEVHAIRMPFKRQVEASQPVT
jgi:hypothetical protein